LEGASAGDEVRLVAPDGAPVGRGLADPDSPLAVRLWTHGDAPIDDALLSARIVRALDLRAKLVPPDTDAYRLIHGEGDRMPGLVLDRYADTAILRCDSEAIASKVPELAAIVRPALDSLGIRSLARRTGVRGRQPSLEILWGHPLLGTTRVQEHGIPYVVDLAHGQKTGAFLDQRENRRRVGDLARGRRMLNLFAYTGGFSLHALIGGSGPVTNVDVAVEAHATAQESLRAAGVDPGRCRFVTADAKEFLESARRRNERWDIIVSDPPSFAPNEKAVSRALTAYRALHRACVDVLAPGGILCASSCSSHVDATMFLRTLDDAAVDRRALSVVGLFGAGPDHPTLAGFPEGQYLKFAILHGP
jgi:23S rRNA (cytosine1962-C5)-methyltransferase